MNCQKDIILLLLLLFEGSLIWEITDAEANMSTTEYFTDTFVTSSNMASGPKCTIDLARQNPVNRSLDSWPKDDPQNDHDQPDSSTLTAIVSTFPGHNETMMDSTTKFLNGSEADTPHFTYRFKEQNLFKTPWNFNSADMPGNKFKRFSYYKLFYVLEEQEKKCAEDPTTDPRCGCDPDCAKYGDCCPDSDYFKAEEQKLGASTASCHTAFSTHFYVMKRCPSHWEDQQTRHLCEHPYPTYPNPRRDTLVTSLRTNTTYHNSYCAACHSEMHQDLFFWQLEASCKFDRYVVEKVDTLEYFERMFYDENTLNLYLNLSGLEITQCAPCTISLTDVDHSYRVNCPSPSPEVLPNDTKAACTLHSKWEERMHLERRLRYCEESISWCSGDWTDETEEELCKAYTAQVSACDFNYRNYHCASCNFIKTTMDPCPSITSTPVFPEEEGVHVHRSFSLLLQTRILSAKCIHRNQSYDSLSHECVEVLPQQRGNRMDDDSCTNVSFSQEEYILAEDNNTVFLPALRTTYYQHEFYIQDGELVVLCLPVKPAIRFSPELGYITTAGLSLSIICILLHLVVMCVVPKLLNLPAMNLASLCFSLLLLYSSFIASGSVHPGTSFCVIIAVVIHYSLVASFLWMLIISFDIFNMTQRTQTKLVALKDRGVQLGRFVIYSTIGWLTSTIIAGSAVLVDHVTPNSSFAPGYGKHRCWFSHTNALLLFCLTPLILVMSLNVVLFLRTSYLIRKMSHPTKTSAAHINFKLNLRLFIIMGLTWITGIFAAAFEAEVLWHLFVVFNTTQGAFIFIAFTCNKKVQQELQNVFKTGNNSMAKYIPATTENRNTQ